MKKTIFLFIAIIILMTGCASNDGYKYADNWSVKDTTIYKYEPTDEFYSHAKRSTDTDLTSLKSVISDFFKDDDFDWENFAKVKNVQNVTVSIDEIPELSYDFLMMLSSYYAMYNDDTKEIYVFPPFLEEVDGNMKTHAIVHELIHVLISTGHKNYSRLEEGLTDYYTCMFLQAIGLTPHPVYLGEMIATYWLIAIYGEDTVLKAVRNGTIDSLIDNATKPGMGAKLSEALLVVHNGVSFSDKEVTEAVNVEFDILSHLAKNQGKTTEVEPWLKYADTAYGSMGISMDTKYFEKI